MIGIDPADQELLRFLWRKGEDVYIYKFQRLPFGLKCSPFILAATLKLHLENSGLDPELVASILENFYVDDWLNSTQNKEEGLNLMRTVTSKLSQANFNLCKWNSNDEDLKEIFSKTAGELPPEVDSVLGLPWDTRADTLGIGSERILEKLNQENIDTKKELFSLMQTVFDPLGMLCPFVLQAKKLMQKTHKTKLDWKERLPDDILSDWKKWKESLSLLPEIKDQRWICVPDATYYRLCGFCDASEEAYSAVVYLVSSNGREVRSGFVISKSRVAPSKGMSIPRMELCSAVLLTNLMAAAADMLKHIKIDGRSYYTDCMSVLRWLISAHYSWPVFIANRIRQILLLTDPKDWHYVNTKENPADLPSRGCFLEELIHDLLWKRGPGFLVTGERPFQGKMNFSPELMPDEMRQELARVVVSYVRVVKPCGVVSCISPDRTNSYSRLMNITGSLLDAVFAFRTCKKGVGKKVHVDWSLQKRKSRSECELEWVRSIQQCHYGKEIAFCQAREKKVMMGERVPSSIIRTLSLFWDSQVGVLRCDTRLEESMLPDAQVYPILLPDKSKFTRMMIMERHGQIGHSGVRQTLATVKAEFHVTRARKLITSLLRGCFTCRKIQAQAFALPPPPPLPKCRLGVTRPFLHVGLDFAGPFHLKGRNAKGYCLIFTCAVVRAVHFEAVQSLSVQGFWMGFRRFMARRGIPSTIISDNASTFKCVAKELNILFNSEKLKEFLNGRRIQWQFYLERAPWQGGFIERVVAMFKANIRKVLGNANIDYEEFLTFVCEAELIINSRPLTYVYESPEGEGPLTPSMLVSGYNLTDLPPIDGMKIGRKDPMIARERLKYINRLIQHFWSRFHKEYMAELVDRGFGRKNKGEVQRAPKEGELVLLRGENLPRSRWKIAVVKEVKRSPRDDKVRTVVVRTLGGGKKNAPTEYRRSPSFLVPLEDHVDPI